MSLESLKTKLSTLPGTTTPQTSAPMSRVPAVSPIQMPQQLPGRQSMIPPNQSLLPSLNRTPGTLPGATISQAPKPTTFQQFKAILPEPLRDGLFGRGQTVDLAGQTKFDTGLLGFIWGGLTKTNGQRFEERTQKLIDEGVTPERAAEVSWNSITGQRQNLSVRESRIIKNQKLWDLGEKALDALDFIPGLGTAIGTTGDITKNIIKGFAKTDDVSIIRKSLVDDFKMAANDAAKLAPEIAKSKDAVVIASKIDEVVRGTSDMAERAGSVTAKLRESLTGTKRAPTGVVDELAPDAVRVSPTPSVKAPPKRVEVKDGGDGPFFRSAEGGKRFESIPEDSVLPAFIRDGLDTFVVKADDGYTVIEGRSGQSISEPAKSVAEAISDAKKTIETMPEGQLDAMLDEAPLSPRYTQSVDGGSKQANPAIEKLRKISKDITTADKMGTASEKSAARRSRKLEVMAETSPTVDKFVDSSGITRAALDATVQKQGYKDAAEFWQKNRPKEVDADEAASMTRAAEEDTRPRPVTEDESLALLGEQEAGSEYALRVAKEEEEQVTANLQQIFADMNGVKLDDPALKFTEEDLYQAQLQYEFVMDALMDDPARALSKFASPTTGRLPEVTGTEFIDSLTGSGKKIRNSTFGRRGDDIITELGFDDAEQAREAYDLYKKRRDKAKEIFENLKEVRQGIRLSKSMDNFVGKQQKALASELAKNRKALASLVEAAERAGFKKGMETGSKKYQILVDRLRDRRQRINALKEVYALSDTELSKLRGPEDPRFMTKPEFETYMDDLEKKAIDLEKRRTEQVIIRAIIEEKSLKNTENLREAMQLPTISEMSLEQLQRYSKILDKLKEGDEVLSKRTLEVIDRTALKGARTTRQVREFLAQEIKRTLGKDVKPEDLDNLTAGAMDYVRYDSSLAESKPFYGFLVNRSQTHMMEGEANFLRISDRVNKLASAARKSRSSVAKTRINKTEVKRQIKNAKAALKESRDPNDTMVLKRTIRRLKWQLGIRSIIKANIAPTHHEMIRFLEARDEVKDMFFKSLTKEEQEYATYIRNYYNSAYNYLSYINEIYGNRFQDAYFTHMRKNFFETFTDDGIVAAMKNMWNSQKEDMAIANIIDSDTGKILPKSKFFQYTLKREGDGEMSENLTRVFLKYAQLLERKKMLDKMIPELDVYTRSLTPKELTARGLEMDRTMKEFVNNYLNNKRGRRFNYGGIIKQNGPADIMLRAGNTLVSMMDLGFNFLAGSAAMVGENVSNFVLLGNRGTLRGFKRRLWDTGMKRMVDPNAANILKEAEPFIGRNIWTELAEVDKPVFEKAMQTLFGLFSQTSVEANKIYLLANLTKAELKAGKISPQRMAAMRLEAGRWRDLGKDVKSIVGATSPGAAWTKYKGWALPILRTTGKNLADIASMLKQGEFKTALTSKQTRELMRQVEITTVALVVGSMIAGSEKDDGPLAKLKARIQQESLTLLGGVDPTVFLATPRLYSWLQQLAGNIKELALMEEYKTDSKYGDKGDLKGLGGLKQQFTPAAIRQFIPDTPAKSSGGGSAKGPAGLQNLNSLKRLNQLKNVGRRPQGTGNSALKNLRNLQRAGQ